MHGEEELLDKVDLVLLVPVPELVQTNVPEQVER